MTKNTNAETYSTEGITLAVARATVSKAAAAYRTFLRSTASAGESKTMGAILATRAALAGGLLVDGRVKKSDMPEGAENRSTFAKRFCTTDPKTNVLQAEVGTSLVTFWCRGSHLIDLGILPESPEWAILVGKKAARTGELGKAVDAAKTPAQVVRALAVAGWDVKTGTKAPTRKGPKDKGGKDDDSQESPETKPVAPFDAAKAAVKVLATALESMPVVSGKADDWHVIRQAMLRIMATEDTRRGTTVKTPSPATVAKAASKVLAPTG